MTGSSGNYTAQVAPGRSATVARTKAGYSFASASRTYANVTSDQAAQDFAAASAPAPARG